MADSNSREIIQTIQQLHENLAKDLARDKRQVYSVGWHGLAIGTIRGMESELKGVQYPTLPDGRKFWAQDGLVHVQLGEYDNVIGVYEREVLTEGVGEQVINVFLDK